MVTRIYSFKKFYNSFAFIFLLRHLTCRVLEPITADWPILIHEYFVVRIWTKIFSCYNVEWFKLKNNAINKTKDNF
ncbi:hypothetical protein BpHYR1_023037 [Brachionus plicatilis]|uniref:Uncharacterized protein n=1 Tax=Brachionus plicatilis TaxID=10195 RepID=A0A3M7QM27_BRAPC|nr:hypothetical protein BpHYR1_023037 [Brachionus plicatilis]